MNINRIKNRIEVIKTIGFGINSSKTLDCGHVYDEVSFMLYSLIKFYKPELVIQTGQLWGKSSIIILEALSDKFLYDNDKMIEGREQDSDENYNKFVKNNTPESVKGKLISIDPFFPECKEKFLNISQQLTDWYPKQYELVNDFSQNVLLELLKKEEIKNKKFIAFIDGDHTYDGCLFDLNTLNTSNNILSIVDDTKFLPDCHRAVYDFCLNNNKKFIDLDKYNGLSLII